MINKNRLLQSSGCILIALSVVYFSLHTLIGNNGFLSMLRLERELILKQEVLKGINEDITHLENRINGLYEETLNKDLLEEEAKRSLGYIQKDEFVIYDID